MPEEDAEESFESENRGFGMGWLREHPDLRDYTPRDRKISELLTKTRFPKALESSDPDRVDLRSWCSPIRNQGSLGSCTAQAGVGLLEFFEKKAFGKYIDASPLFLYKATRNLMQLKGDTGAYIRTTLGAIVLFGVPPEKYWRYTTSIFSFDAEPPAFCYAFGENFKAVNYFKFDTAGVSPSALLLLIKKNLVSGLASMFGFTVYRSIDQAEKKGKIPLPCPNEGVLGGHAVVAVGYDDKMVIRNESCSLETKGALLIRNSWGEKWGEKGYGWLPYDYVQKGLAVDWWSIISANWVDTGEF